MFSAVAMVTGDLGFFEKPENHKTKICKSKKKAPKKPVSYYDILAGPQKWMLLDAYQAFDQTKVNEISDGAKLCTVKPS